MNKIEAKVFEIACPYAKDLGLELVEVEYRRIGGGMELTLYIDKDTGVSINDCEALHTAIDLVLDEYDISEGKPYTLGVSSLGLDRPLKTAKDFARNLNTTLEVKLYAPQMGKKLFCGKLIAFTDSTITLLIGSEEKTFELSKTALVQKKIEF